MGLEGSACACDTVTNQDGSETRMILCACVYNDKDRQQFDDEARLQTTAGLHWQVKNDEFKISKRTSMKEAERH